MIGTEDTGLVWATIHRRASVDPAFQIVSVVLAPLTLQDVREAGPEGGVFPALNRTTLLTKHQNTAGASSDTQISHTVNVRRVSSPGLAVSLANAISISIAEWGCEIYAVKLCFAVRVVELVKPRAGLEDVGMSTRFNLRLRPAVWAS